MLALGAHAQHATIKVFHGEMFPLDIRMFSSRFPEDVIDRRYIRQLRLAKS